MWLNVSNAHSRFPAGKQPRNAGANKAQAQPLLTLNTGNALDVADTKLNFPDAAMLRTLKRFSRRKKSPDAQAVVSPTVPPDFLPEVAEIIRQVKPYTMTSPERIDSLCNSVRYVVDAAIPGDIVECGVWRGGSMMAAAMQLQQCGGTTRELFLYDTYEGMSEPTGNDVDSSGNHAAQLMAGDDNEKDSPNSIWCVSHLDEVKRNVARTGYPQQRLHFIKGKVEETIPQHCPEEIAILRLDTDWYESTRHELIHLYPRLVPGGVLIIDDYGHWQGCRRAVDEYFRDSGNRILLNRIDYTGRIAVKTG